MLRLKRMRSPHYEGHALPSTMHTWTEWRGPDPGEESHPREHWFRFDQPALVWMGPAGVAHLRDGQGTWTLYPERREYHSMAAAQRFDPEMLPMLSVAVVAEYAMEHIRRFGDLVPPEGRDELFICEASAVTVEPDYHEFHWKSRSKTSRIEGILRYDPEDGWIRYLEGTNRDRRSGAVLGRGSTRTGYNEPVPPELFDPAAAGFRLLGPDEWARTWEEVVNARG